MVCEMAIRDGNSSGSLNGIYQTILAFFHGNMVNPNIAGAKDGDSIAITPGPNTIVILRISNKSTTTNNNVINLDSMDDHILDKLDGDASTFSNVNIGSSSINGLVTSYNELLVEPNDHATCKDDPQGSISCDCMAKGTWFWIEHVTV